MVRKSIAFNLTWLRESLPHKGHLVKSRRILPDWAAVV